MQQYVIQLTDEEHKAIAWDALSVQDWIHNAAHNKARQCVERIVAEHSPQNPRLLTYAQKLALVADAPVQSAADRQAHPDPDMPP